MYSKQIPFFVKKLKTFVETQTNVLLLIKYIFLPSSAVGNVMCLVISILINTTTFLSNNTKNSFIDRYNIDTASYVTNRSIILWQKKGVIHYSDIIYICAEAGETKLTIIKDMFFQYYKCCVYIN